MSRVCLHDENISYIQNIIAFAADGASVMMGALLWGKMDYIVLFWFSALYTSWLQAGGILRWGCFTGR